MIPPDEIDVMIDPSEKPAEPIVLEDIWRLVLEPGDILVVRVQGTVTMEVAERITRTVEHYLPGHKVLVLPAEQVDIQVLGRQPTSGPSAITVPTGPSAAKELRGDHGPLRVEGHRVTTPVRETRHQP